jgi:hypothetical protein
MYVCVQQNFAPNALSQSIDCWTDFLWLHSRVHVSENLVCAEFSSNLCCVSRQSSWLAVSALICADPTLTQNDNNGNIEL